MKKIAAYILAAVIASSSVAAVSGSNVSEAAEQASKNGNLSTPMFSAEDVLDFGEEVEIRSSEDDSVIVTIPTEKQSAENAVEPDDEQEDDGGPLYSAYDILDFESWVSIMGPIEIRSSEDDSLIRTIPLDEVVIEEMDPNFLLGRGSVGEDVKKVQALLAKNGFLSEDDIDGKFGKNTEQAVKDFQHSIGEPETGVVHEHTFKMMDHEYGEWEIVDEGGYKNPKVRKRTCSDCGLTEAEVSGELVAPGDRGENVLKIQEALSNLGYDVDRAGVYGKLTEKAVMEYQESAGFEADGIVWPGVWNALVAG